MLVSLKELMADACKNNYAVGAFNATSLETLTAVIKAGEETGKGVILNYAEVHTPYITIEDIGPIMIDRAKKAKVPVCVHLDHSPSVESCMRAIRLGFTSVMLDVSGADYETNVKETALMCRLAHSVGVTVEAELGQVLSTESGGETATADSALNAQDVYTDPDMAKDFVERTGVDALAIAFGTAHGVYSVKPKLDLDRIKLIREKIDVPFVMHGGSGLTKEEFQTAIKNGIRKINYYTYMAMAGGKAVKEAMDRIQAGQNVFYHDIPLIGIEAMKNDVANAIKIFSLEV